MARLPDVTERRPVGDGRRPIASIRNAGAEGEAFAGLGRSIEGAAHSLDDVLAAQRQEEEEARAAEIYADYAEKERALLFDPEAGFLNTSGSAAVNGRQSAIDALKALREQSERDAGEAVAKRLRPILQQREISTLTKIDTHTSAQRKAWLDTSARAVIASAADDAIANFGTDGAIDAAIGVGLSSIRRLAERNGWSAEELALEEEQFVSGALKAVAFRRGEFDPVGAMEYARANGHRLSGADMAHIEQVVGRPAREHAGRQAVRDAWATGRDLSLAMESGDPAKIAAAVMPALVWQESRNRTGLISPAGAKGLTQMMPDTARAAAKRLGIAYDEDRLLNDRDYALTLGTEELRHLLARYDNNVVLALAAYNAGPGNVNKWLGGLGDPRSGGPDSLTWAANIPFRETREYVSSVLGRMGEGSALATIETMTDPVQRRAAEAENNALAAQRRAEAEAFAVGFEDEIAALQMGIDAPDSKFTQAALVEKFGPAEGQRLWDTKMQAEETGRIFKSIALAPESQIAEQRERLAAETRDPVGFQQAQARLDAFDKAVAARRKALAEDPAAYTAANMPAVREAMEGEEPDFEQIAAMQISTQAGLGVPEWGRRVLGKAQAASVVADLNAAPSAEVGDQIRGMADQWGDYFGAVRAELSEAGMDPGYYIASLYTENPALMQQVIERTRAGAELEKGLPSVEVRDLRLALEAELEPWRQAFEAGSPGSASAEWNKLAAAVDAWAIGEMRAGRDSPAGAAIAQFMDSKWLLLDGGSVHAMIPREVNGVLLDEDMVEAATETLQAEKAIREFAPATIGPEGIPLDDEGRTQGGEDTIRAAVNHGQWIMNDAGDALVLSIPASSDGLGRPVPGAMLPLVDRDGNPYEVRLEDIPAVLADAEPRPSAAMTGGARVTLPPFGLF